MSEYKCKPFLKWVGGKTQILSMLFKHFPDECQDYKEIFLGGGSVLIHMLELQKQKKIKIKGNVFAFEF